MKFVLPKVSATGAHQLSRLFVLLALLVGGLSSLLCATLAAGRQITKEVRHSQDGDIAFWNTVKQVDVIYVGETHDDPADHEYQIQLIRGLLARKLGFAVGWEMFDWTQQALLEDWHRRRISLDELLSRTDFQKSWGLYSPAYSKILKITGQNRIRNIALNAPAELPRKIAHGENLTREERRMVPKGFVTTEGAYQNFVSMIGDHPGMQRSDLRRFFDAQEVWDQTMAARILGFTKGHPGGKLVVLTGRGHLLGGYGIPFYVRQKSNLKQLVLLR